MLERTAILYAPRGSEMAKNILKFLSKKDFKVLHVKIVPDGEEANNMDYITRETFTTIYLGYQRFPMTIINGQRLYGYEQVRQFVEFSEIEWE